MNSSNYFADAMDDKQVQALGKIRAKLGSGAYRFVQQSCPCGTPGRDVKVARQDRYGLPLEYLACTACGTVRLSPNLTPDSWRQFYEEDYSAIKHRAHTGSAETRREDVFEEEKQQGRRIFAARQVKEILARSGNGARPLLLDVGCGNGGMVQLANELGFEAHGCDYESEAVKFATSRGLAVTPGGMEPYLAGGSMFDMVVLSHVLEHVFDPFEFLKMIHSVLKPGGMLYIELPGLRAVTFARYRGNFLRYLRMFHPFNFDLHSLSVIAARAGFILEQGDEWITAWFRKEASGAPALPQGTTNVVSYIKWLRIKKHLYPAWCAARKLVKGNPNERKQA